MSAQRSIASSSAPSAAPTRPRTPGDALAADRALARRAAERDEHAWREIFAMAADLMAGAAWRYGLDDARDDLLQDVMERLLLRIGTYRGESPLRVWVASVCYNRLRNAYRARRVQDRVFVWPAAGDDVAAPTSADADVVAESDHALTAAAMAGLREPHWNVVLLRVLAELSVEEAAQRLAVREGTVKSRLSRALAELRLFTLVLHGTSVDAAARASGMSFAVAAAKIAGALPIWRERLPSVLVAGVEWRLLAESGHAAA